MPHNQYIGYSKFKKSEEPVVGYKKSYLALLKENGKDIIVLQPIQGRMQKHTLMNDVSGCPSTKRHDGKPAQLCTCGFHAYFDIKDALEHVGNMTIPIIETVSSGKIVLYAKGVRAAHQRVSKVIMDTCFITNCPLPADRISVSTNEGMIFPYCNIHASRMADDTVHTFKWLEEKINASFTNGEPAVSVVPLKKSTVVWDGVFPKKILEPETPVFTAIPQNPLDKFIDKHGMKMIGAAFALITIDAVRTFTRKDY